MHCISRLEAPFESHRQIRIQYVESMYWILICLWFSTDKVVDFALTSEYGLHLLRYKHVGLRSIEEAILIINYIVGHSLLYKSLTIFCYDGTKPQYHSSRHGSRPHVYYSFLNVIYYF